MCETCKVLKADNERLAGEVKILDCQIVRWRQSSNRHLAKLIRTKGELEQMKSNAAALEESCENWMDDANDIKAQLTAAQQSAKEQFGAGMERAAEIARQKGVTLGSIVSDAIREAAKEGSK